MKVKKQKGILYAVMAAMLLVVGMQQSCKKTESNPIESVSDPSTTFFKMPTTAPNAVKRVVAELQQQNSNKTFVAQFIQQEGMPVWDKASVTVSGRTPAAGTRSLSSISKPDTTVIVPIVFEKGDHVGAFFLATVNDSLSIRLFRNSDYTRFPYDDGTVQRSTTAEEFALQMMKMDRDVFGYTKFQLKDSLLFRRNERIDAGTKISREIDLGSNKTGGSTTSLLQQVCVTISTTTTTTVNHCPYQGNCSGPNGACDNCPQVCATVTSTTSSSTYCDNVYTDGGDPTWPSFPGGGGGGGGNPGGTPPCPLPVPFASSVIPTSCQGQVPNPWPPVSTYQLTANDIRIINQLNAEDEETDNILTQSDCQGTKRTGNIYFHGTMEHWLIQLDYIAKHPVEGDREYAIPQSSPAGNRGYADLVNEVSREIFEIKPPSLLVDGQAEVLNYVDKAKKFCNYGPVTSTWHPGTNYPTTILLSKDPHKYLKAELKPGGVIVYTYIDRINNPTPAPIVVPSTVLDKLKDLADRLKNRLSNADAIISEYMALHPELITYLKGAAVGAAVGIIVGTLIEDLATAGSGILDDWLSFKIAYRIVRFAWAH